MLVRTETVLKFISLWPPFLFSGIRVVEVDSNVETITVRLKSYFWNRNYFGTHFGGSLYSMCDPFFVFLATHKLAKEHIIWDKAASINFIKATNATVYAKFTMPQSVCDEIAEAAKHQFSVLRSFQVQVLSETGELIAEVEKELYIRRKDAKERFNPEKLNPVT